MPSDAATLKADAMQLLEARRDRYIVRGRRALLVKMLGGDGTATADDVRAAVELPPDLDARCLGAVAGRLLYDKIIEPVGFIRSQRPAAHARWIERWRLKDPAAARRWLADHPDLPDPEDADRGGERQAFLFSTGSEGGL